MKKKDVAQQNSNNEDEIDIIALAKQFGWDE